MGREPCEVTSTPSTSSGRQSGKLMLIKVRAAGSAREEVFRLAEVFRGRGLDVTSATCIIELTGTVDKLDAFVNTLDEKIVLEVARCGAMGMARGERSLRI